MIGLRAVEVFRPTFWRSPSSEPRPSHGAAKDFGHGVAGHKRDIIARQIMDEPTPTNIKRKTPGPAFFMAALFVYLCLVQGASLLSIGPQPAMAPLAEDLPGSALLADGINGFLAFVGYSPRLLQFADLALLYGCMISIFHLTQHLTKGPVWLGSLAAAVFMAHPAKTEVFFGAEGLVHLLAAFSALLSLLTFLRAMEKPCAVRHGLALALFSIATIPFVSNLPLLIVLVLVDGLSGTPSPRRWYRLAPFIAVALIACVLHRDVFNAPMPDLAGSFAPLLLLIYPIGLLPETLTELQATPLWAWGWALLGATFVVVSLVFIRNGGFRISLLALLCYRLAPGLEAIDLASLAGGGQLLLPIALGAVALAGFCRWLMTDEIWGKPTVALTTMLCLVLFILQFQANRAYGKVSALSAPPELVTVVGEDPPHA